MIPAVLPLLRLAPNAARGLCLMRLAPASMCAPGLCRMATDQFKEKASILLPQLQGIRA